MSCDQRTMTTEDYVRLLTELKPKSISFVEHDFHDGILNYYLKFDKYTWIRFRISEKYPQINEIVLYSYFPFIFNGVEIDTIVYYSDETELIPEFTLEGGFEYEILIKDIENDTVTFIEYLSGDTEIEYKPNRIFRRNKQKMEQPKKLLLDEETRRKFDLNLEKILDDNCLSEYFKRNPFIKVQGLKTVGVEFVDLPIDTI